MVDEHNFGQMVRTRRRALELTQEDLARRVGCAAITVRKIEAGSMRPSQQVAERLALALQIPPDEQVAFAHAARTVRVGALAILPTAPVGDNLLSVRIGETASRSYQLGEQIGNGSFGVIYRGVQLRLDRPVAIKVIHPQYADHPDFIRRFEAEARMVARLEHPHIVPLYDYWREPGVAYLVMRYVRGGSLLHLLQQGPPPLALTLRIVEELGAALHVAHRAGVIHRDLKPANVLLDEDAHAYLADFGIARDVAHPDAALTFANTFAGSPAYAAPEQFLVEPIGPQTDIYALGIVLYEMLTGQQPFPGPRPIDYLQQHLNLALPSLAPARPDLPPALDAVVQRATAKQPTDRYPTVELLLADLRAASEVSFSPQPEPPHQLAATPTVVLDLAGYDNPYRGLQPFSEADAAIFFGREGAVQRLLDRMAEGGELSRFLALVGPSGNGKSSLVRAGLLPALRRGALPGAEHWFTVDFVPGADPFSKLAAALLQVAPSGLEASLHGLLRENSYGLLQAIKLLLPPDPQVELLLFIDQFEELFTLCSDEATRRDFLESLITATLDAESRLRVLLTMRADFVDRPLQYVDFGELFSQRSEPVLPLTPDGIERTIVGPARWAGLALEEGLVRAIIADIGAEPGALPLLQHALSELYNARQGRLLTHAAYTAIGGVAGALSSRAEALFNQLDLAGQATARRTLLALVSPGVSQDTRRRVARAELQAAGPPALVEHILASFGSARLLTFDREPFTREPTVEVAHEALLRAWPRLRAWLDASRERLQIHRRLAAAAAEWNATGRDEGFLASGGRLAQFETLIDDQEIGLNELERTYLQTSLLARERQAQATLSLATLAYQQQQAAQERALVAQGQVLAAAARAAIAEGNLDQARSLATIAVQMPRPAPEAQAILSQAAYAPGTRRLFSGHAGAVIDAVFMADGKFVLSGSSDLSLRIWDAQSGVEQQRLHGLSDNLWRVAASPNGQLVAASSRTGLVHVWNVARAAGWRRKTKDEGRTWRGLRPSSFVFRPSPVRSHELYRLHGHSDETTGLAFSPDGKTLLSASKDHTMILWDIASGTPMRTLTGHDDWVWGVAWSPDGRTIVSGSSDNTLRLWDVASGAELQRLSGHGNRVHAVAWSPDGRQIVSGSWDETLRLWDVASGATIGSFASNSGTVASVAFSPDGRQIAFGSANSVCVWDIARDDLLYRFREHRDEVFSVCFSADGRSILSGSRDGTLRLWDLANGAELQRIVGHTSWIRSVFYSPDGQRAASGSWDRSARLWDLRSGQTLLKLDGHADSVESVALSPDGSLILTGSADATLGLWDATTGQLLRRFTGHGGYVWDVAFSPDQQSVLSASHDGSIRQWELGTGAELRRFVGHAAGVESIALSRDGQLLLSGSADGSVRLWHVATGMERQRLKGHNGTVSSVALSPNGRYALSGSADGTARLWDLATGQDLQRFPKQAGPVLCVAFSPDGQYALFGAGTTALALWDVAGGQELRRFDTAGALVYSAVFSADGQSILAGATDGTLRLWRIDSLASLLDWIAQHRYIPELSDAQRNYYQL
jgi:WD40 repeat protein/transcriptional regulator with XRE-family HTH domain